MRWVLAARRVLSLTACLRFIATFVVFVLIATILISHKYWLNKESSLSNGTISLLAFTGKWIATADRPHEAQQDEEANDRSQDINDPQK